MALYISTVDGVVGYVAVYLYWGRCGREYGEISTGDGMVGYGVVDLYRGRC